MARISTYANDPDVRDNDRLIGTDGGRLDIDGQVVAGTAGSTKNFTVAALRNYFMGGTGLDPADNLLQYQTRILGETEDIQPFTVNVVTLGVMHNLPQEPRDGDWLKIVNIAGVSNVMLNAGTGINIMGQDDPVLVLDDHTASFEMVYIGLVYPLTGELFGWAIVGAN